MGVVLKDTSKPSVEELLARIAQLEAEKSTPSKAVDFTRSDKNRDWYSFNHNVKGGGWPIGGKTAAWRVLIANVDIIRSKLPK